MKITDNGFLIFLKKYEENSLYVKILSENNGIISGYVNKINKKNIYIYQIGNLVHFIWSSRNPNSLGSLKLELKQSNISFIINNKFNLYLINTINLLLNNLIYERYIETKFFNNMNKIYTLILMNQKKEEILKEYLIFENLILNSVGIGYFKKQKEINENILTFISVINNKNLNRKNIFTSFNYLNSFLKNYLLNNNLEKIYISIKTCKKNILNNF